MTDPPENVNKTRKKLHFGVMCNGFIMKSWQKKCLEALMEQPGVELRLVLINQSPQTLRRSLWYKWNSLLYRLFTRFFYKPSSLDNVPVEEFFQEVDKIPCTPRRKGKFSEYFKPEDLERIRSYELDLILRMGFGIIRGAILDLPRYGVWSFHHGDPGKYRGGPPGFWEIYHNQPVTGMVLQKLTRSLDAGIILQKGYLKTVAHSCSFQVDQLMQEGIRWPARFARQLQYNPGILDQKEKPEKSGAIYRVPGNLTFFLFLLKSVFYWFRFHISDLFLTEKWNIGIFKATPQELIKEGTMAQPQWAPEPERNVFRADPFAHEDAGEVNILYENFNRRTKKGSIYKMRYTEAKGFHAEKPMLEKDHHLAYPYLTHQDKEIFCIPESSGTQRIDLYKIDRISEALIPHKTLMEIDAVDSTLFFYGGLWWLMCTRKSTGSNSHLYLYYSNSMTGPYRAHLKNPVKIDIRGSRPAGQLIFSGKEMYRPAQDSSHTYGGRIRIFRILKLAPCDFEEELVSVIAPGRCQRYRRGIHTLSGCGAYTLIDGKRMVFNYLNFRRQLKRKLRITGINRLSRK